MVVLVLLALVALVSLLAMLTLYALLLLALLPLLSYRVCLGLLLCSAGPGLAIFGRSLYVKGPDGVLQWGAKGLFQYHQRSASIGSIA